MTFRLGTWLKTKATKQSGVDNNRKVKLNCSPYPDLNMQRQDALSICSAKAKTINQTQHTSTTARNQLSWKYLPFISDFHFYGRVGSQRKTDHGNHRHT